MANGDTKIVINSITYDDNSNNILIGIRSDEETEDSRNVVAVLDNSDKRFSSLNLEGLTATLSYDYGTGYTATSPLTVITQDDITSGGNYQTVLGLSGDMDMISEDNASADYNHHWSSTKTVKDLLTEILDGQPVEEDLTEENLTGTGDAGYYHLYDGIGQRITINGRTVKTLSFWLKKTGSPTGNITFYIRDADDLTVYNSKVLANASTLTTSYVKYTVTFTTPVEITAPCYIYPEYTDGDISNYISVKSSATDVYANSWSALLPAAGAWTENTTTDCVFSYTYSYAGISVFEDCQEYTATYDSDDSLIDTFMPVDAFKISEGESRLNVVNRLLDYTACYKRSEDDGEIHFFTKPTSGNEYTSNKGDFYNHANRKALVVPNKIIVKSYNDSDGYSGSSTSAASFAKKPIIGSPVRAAVISDAQASSMAAAIISRLEVNSQVGSALVPMDNFEQIWNYVTVVNNWNGSTTTGNIAFISRRSIGGVFQQYFSFGRQAKRGIAGLKPKRDTRTQQEILDDTTLTWGKVKNIFSIIDENTDDIYDKLNTIFLNQQDIAKFIEALDLTVFGVSNLSDITIDENKDWVTKLIKNIGTPVDDQDAATKKYVDDNSGSLSVSYSNPTRAIDTNYQNGSNVRIITVTVELDNGDSCAIKKGSGSPASTLVTFSGNLAGSGALIYVTMTAVIEPNYYYQVDTTGGTPAIYEWTEWDLSVS
jgi:hypothetical protein